MLNTKLNLRLLSVAVAVALLAAACRGSDNYVMLDSDDPIAELPEGLLISANPAGVPAGFGVQARAIAPDAFLAGEAGEAWLPAAAALPAHLRLSSPLFAITTTGRFPEAAFISIKLPAAAAGRPFDLYEWNGAAWQFLAAQERGGQMVATVSAAPGAVALFEPAALPPLAGLMLEPGQALSAEAAEAANVVLLGGVLARADGSLAGQLAGVPLDQAYAVFPVVRDYGADAAGPEGLAAVLGDDALRTRHMQTLLTFALSDDYGGLALDYATITPGLGPAYAQFVHDLGEQLRAQGKGLFVVVPPPAYDGQAVATGGYDWRALGAGADALMVAVGAEPAAFGDGRADALLGWAVGQVERGRLRLLTTALSADAAGGTAALLPPDEALAHLGSVALANPAGAAELVAGQPLTLTLTGGAESLAYDAQAFAPTFTYRDGGQTHQVWLVNAGTLRQRLALAEKYRLGGVVVTDLLRPGMPADLANAITQYKVSMQAAAEAQASLQWTVSNGSGVLAVATGQPAEPYVFVAPAAGEYQFAAGVQPGSAAGLGSVAVRIAEITPTPTPTATPTQATVKTGGSSSGSNTGETGGGAAPEPTVPPSGGGVTLPPPISGGSFELGGQVPGYIGHPAEMKQAHMRWVKFQARSGEDASGMISAGHSAGFKVLISALGDHARAADPAYWPEYSSWVAGIAAAGADAIEVWNEANIDREWTTGQIHGGTYTELLKQAYTAIKGASGGTLVISGAPAPTGAEAAFPGRVVNDNTFLAQMAAAGAANYMDCVGVHYNEGVLSPNQSSGDPRDSYYSRYYSSMVSLYYGSFGGSRPLCFTELGYLTPEGYPPLDPFFGWGANTSIAEQAQWLAEAASLSGSSGKVRLMIVFNVDFTYYGQDPQAGYAIVRADGSCPACSALGAVVP